MSDATPERFAICNPCNRAGMRNCAHFDECGNAVEYIRADLHQAALDRAEADAVARVEAMRAACKQVANRHRALVDINEPLWHEGQDWACERIAEAIDALTPPAPMAVAQAARVPEVAALIEAVGGALKACDEGRMVGGGISGMTIEAIIRGSRYNGIPAWPIEELRTALAPFTEAKP